MHYQSRAYKYGQVAMRTNTHVCTYNVSYQLCQHRVMFVTYQHQKCVVGTFQSKTELQLTSIK